MKPDWRQVVLYIATMGTQGCWLFALIDLLNRQTAEGRLWVPGLLLVYPLSSGVNLLLRRPRWPPIFVLAISWLLWVVTMLLVTKIHLFSTTAWADTSWLLAVPRAIADMIYSFQPELLLLISTAVLWWLGQRLVYIPRSFTALVSEFQFGLAMLAVAFLASSLLGVALAAPVPVALIFFLSALLGISVGHATEGTSWLSGLYRGHWSGLLIISISLVLILGVLISSVVTHDFLDILWTGIKWLWGLIVKAMVYLASLFPEPEPAEPPPVPTMPPVQPDEGFQLWTLPESLRGGLRVGWTVLIIGLVVFALWRVSSDIFRWLRRKLAGMAGAEFEPMPGAFRADLLGFLKRIFARLLGIRLPLHTKVKTLLPEVASVRQIYRQFLRWAADAGYPRHVSQTPREFFDLLAGLLPQAQADLELITQQYVRTRYGGLVPDEESVERLSQTWHRVKQYNLKRVKKERTSGQEAIADGRNSQGS